MFVDAGAGITRTPWKDAVGQIVIGSEAWVERMRGILESYTNSKATVSSTGRRFQHSSHLLTITLQGHMFLGKKKRYLS
jgi:hypothetical protein